jgi:hypothetical protein
VEKKDRSLIMKKYIYGYIHLAFAIVIGVLGVVGCEDGSNDVLDTVNDEDRYVSLQRYVKEQNSTNFAVTFFLSKEKDVQSKLGDFSVSANGCTINESSVKYSPSSLTMVKGVTSGEISVSGTFTEACSPKSYILSYKNSVSVDDRSQSISSIFDTNNIDKQLLEPGYHLVNVSSPIVITDAEQNATISVQLVHDGLPVLPIRPCEVQDGTTTVTTDCVIPEPIPKQYGRVDMAVWPQQDEGDEDGTDGVNDNAYIRFPYVAPSDEDMPKYETSYDFKIYYVDKDGNRVADTTITIDIKPSQGRDDIDQGVKSVSLVYAGTRCIDSGGVAMYVAHAVDKYGNPVPNIPLKPSLINGYKVLNINSPMGGTLEGGTPTTLTDGQMDFLGYNVTNEDRLIILPNSSNFSQSYLGNWTISEVTNSSLILKENYGDDRQDNLSYIVGNEKRYLEGYGVAVADIVKSQDYVTDSKGEVPFEVVFDRVLAGHTFTLALEAYIENSSGETFRAGISKVSSFRWDNFVSSVVTVPIDGNSHRVWLTIGISDCQGESMIEPLINIRIVPDSIVISDKNACKLDVYDSDTNLTTDHNGQISLVINTNKNSTTTQDENATEPTDGGSGECEISWSGDNGGGMYQEY